MRESTPKLLDVLWPLAKIDFGNADSFKMKIVLDDFIDDKFSANLQYNASIRTQPGIVIFLLLNFVVTQRRILPAVF